MFDGLVAWLGEYGEKIQGAEALLAIILLIGGAAFFPVKQYLKRREAPAEVKIINAGALIAATAPPKGIQMDVETFVAFQKQMRDEALKSVAEAHGEEKKRLEEKIDALNARLADPDRALAEQRAIIASLEEKLSRQGNQLGRDAVTEAKAALEAGDFTKARSLFESVAAQTAPDVKTHADAAFALGQIAETEIRWHDAAEHFATAAKLNPGFDKLQKARELAWRAGDYAAAFRFGEDLLKWTKSEGTEEQFAEAIHQHAMTLYAQGQYGQAEALYRKAIEIDVATIGTVQPGYATRLNNLASAVRAQGRYAEAERLYRQALEIDAATIGTANLEYAIHLNNLAGAVRAQGRYSEADRLYRQALEIGVAAIGPTHPDYAIHLNNLAGMVEAQGRYADAEELYRQALEIDAATIGTGHPEYATHLHNLAGAVREQGQFAEAEKLYEQALEIAAATIGTAHPAYAARLSNYAGAVEAQGRYAEAEGLCRKALEIDAATIGIAHPDYANHLKRLADILWAQQRHIEAADLYRPALAVCCAALGDKHPHTAGTAQLLLSLLLTHFPDDPEIPALQALLAPTA